MSIKAVILGGAGYVGGELLRLVHAHPRIEFGCALSDTYANAPVSDVFPNLRSAFPDKQFVATGEWPNTIDDGSDVAFFSAAPHGASAAAVANALQVAAEKNLNIHVVDSSADFRFDNAATFAGIYGSEHAAPDLMDRFVCSVPEHTTDNGAKHAGHPGCFATAALIATVPLVTHGFVADDVYLTGITGSTGSGRNAKPGTHHPDRHSNLYAYNPLRHRHAPEIEELVGKACGSRPNVHFVPHSGPFARGIHMTLQAPLRKTATAAEIRAACTNYYADSPFVSVVDGTPRLKDVVASNHSHLGIAVDGNSVTALCVIDNLVKGAAGGAMQWMNRLWSLPETEGLVAVSPSWT